MFHFHDDPSMYFCQTPVDELDDDKAMACRSCEAVLPVEAFYDGAEKYYCEHCAQTLTRTWLEEAQTYAEENCRITERLPPYDYSCEFRCTPDEYESGYRESYTADAYHCHCRHNCTNYECLVNRLDRDNAEHRVYYAVIRDYMDEVLEDHEDYMRDEDEDDDDDEDEEDKDEEKLK